MGQKVGSVGEVLARRLDRGGREDSAGRREGGIDAKTHVPRGCEGSRTGKSAVCRGLGEGLKEMRSVTLCRDPEPLKECEQRSDT